MKYKYVPNTYDRIKVNQIGEDIFLEYQIKYRGSIEKFLQSKINFEEIEKELNELNLPIIEDKDYNFYHKFSNIHSKYLYLRNNFHIENLNKNEIQYINDMIGQNQLLSDEFLLSTYERVIYEKGDNYIFGLTNLDNSVKSKSFVFEISYSRKKCEGLNHKIMIDSRLPILKNELKEKMEKQLNKPVSILIYDGAPDIYKEAFDLNVYI